MKGLIEVLRRELRIRWRSSVGWMSPLLFFLAAAATFALALGPDPEQLLVAAPAVLWCAALFANLLSQESILRADIDNGFAEQMLLSDQPLVMLALAKALGHWLATGAPLAVIAPAAAVLLGVPFDKLALVCLLLAMGTLVFSLLATFIAAIAAAANNSLLSTILALPLAVPTLIFGSIATRNLIFTGEMMPSVLMLAATFTFGLTTLPLATAGTLRACVSYA